MIPNMGNMQGMLKKVQKMQADMAKVQEDLKVRKFEHTAGGGGVKVVLNGEKIIEALTIAPDAVDIEDMEMLQDMIIGAINEAMRQVDEVSEKELSKVTGGMQMPPGLF